MKTAFCLAFLLYFLLPLSVFPAAAQEAIPDDEVRSVYEREREDYRTEGVPVGAWRFRPSASLGYRYSDNIYASQTNERSDNIVQGGAGAQLVSNWNLHQLGVSGSVNAARFADNNEEDYEDYDVAAFGRMDTARDSYLSGRASYGEMHESRSSPNDASGIEPTTYASTRAEAGYRHTVNRTYGEVGGQYEKLNYDDARAAGGAVIDNDFRDRDEYRVIAESGYEFMPNYTAFVRGVYNEREYDRRAAVNRNSNGYEATAGVTTELTGKVRASAYAGYLEQDYESNTLPNISSVSFGGDMLWNVTGLTSLKAGLSRSVEETVFSDYSGYLATAFTLGVEHELMRNVLVNARSGYELNEYEATGTVPEREDDLVTAGAGARYLFRRGVTLNLDYDYSQRDSSLASEDFDVNQVVLSTALAF